MFFELQEENLQSEPQIIWDMANGVRSTQIKGRLSRFRPFAISLLFAVDNTFFNERVAHIIFRSGLSL